MSGERLFNQADLVRVTSKPSRSALHVSIFEPVYDRACGNRASLLALPDIAGGSWSDRARHAALILSGTRDESESTVVVAIPARPAVWESIQSSPAR